MSEERKQVNVTLPSDLHRALRVRAANECTTLQDLVEALLTVGMKWIEPRGKKATK